MITKAIKEVLDRDNRVILPDLGAIIHDKDLSNALFFNEHIKFDDENIAKQLSDMNQSELESAKLSVEEYVKTIKRALDRKQPFNIEGIGSLTTAPHDKIILEIHDTEKAFSEKIEENSSHTTKYNTHDTGMGKNPVHNPGQSVEHPDKTDESPHGTVLPTAADTVEPEHDSATIDEIEADQYGLPDLDIEEVEASLVEQERSTTPPEHPPEKQYNTKNEETEKPVGKEKRKNKVLVPLLLGALALGAIGTAIGYYYMRNQALKEADITETTDTEENTEKNLSYEEGEGTETLEPLETDITGSGDETADDATVSPEEEGTGVRDDNEGDNISTTNTTEDTYSIIVGGFSIEKNADKFVHSLREKGIYTDKFIKNENYFYVGFPNIKSRKEATEKLKEVRVHLPEAWMKKTR